MGEKTLIEWADHTFNPWIGCTKVSPACDHCYAEKLATARLGVAWGPHAERRRTAESTWRQPLAWNRKAERERRRARVFCASLADVFDNQVATEWRDQLWNLITDTPSLDWLLLTKRPQNIAKMLPHRINNEGYAWPLRNVWLGTTVENQAEAARRIPHLLAAPAAVRFLSCEPLLGPLDLWSDGDGPLGGGHPAQAEIEGPNGPHFIRHGTPRIHWVITGGESGPGARPMRPDWARGLRDQCQAAGVPFFFKQWGDWLPVAEDDDGERIFVAPDDGGDEFRLPEERRFRVNRDWPEQTMAQVGKKAAGALLDGREHREVPGA